MSSSNSFSSVTPKEFRSTNQQHLRVLIVEDDVTSEPIWEYIFSKLDPMPEISWATSVIEAEEILDRSIHDGVSYDIILADIFLSGSLTGIDLWEELQEGMPNLVILMSASEPAKIRKYFKNMGNVKYLQKPLNIHETVETLREILHQQGLLTSQPIERE